MDDDIIVSSTRTLDSSNRAPLPTIRNRRVTITPSINDAQMPTSESITGGLNLLSVGKYLLFFIFILFLGFNIFTILSNSSGGFVGDFLSSLGYEAGNTVKRATNAVAKGAKLGVNVAEGTIDDAVTLIEKSVGVKDATFNRIDNSLISTKKAIRDATKKQRHYNVPDPDDATSSTQKNQRGKAGYCYIGEDRGFRSCISVGEEDKCMSGDIFPTEAICVNPNLRE